MGYYLVAGKQRFHVLVLVKKLHCKTKLERRKGKIWSTDEEVQGVEMGRGLLAHSVPAEDLYHVNYAAVHDSAQFYAYATPLNVVHCCCGIVIDYDFLRCHREVFGCGSAKTAPELKRGCC